MFGVGIYPPIILMGLAIAGTLLRGGRVARLSRSAWLAVGFLAVYVLTVYAGLGTGPLRVPVAYWLLPFVAGLWVRHSRRLEEALTAIAVISVPTALIAIYEALTGLPVGQLFPVLEPGAASLANYQYRGGGLRAEVTWGHGIALVGFLGSGAWVLLRLRSGTLRWIGIALCVGGILATHSRTGLVVIAMLALFGLWCAFDVLSIRVIGVLAFSGILLLLSTSFGGRDANTEFDYAQSSSYRDRVLQSALAWSRLFGPADYLSFGNNGVSLGGYRFLDNSLLQVSVFAGLAAAALLLCIYLTLLVRALVSRSDSLIVCALQLPTLVFTGFIGQHQTFFWFLLGIAFGVPETVKNGSSSVAHTHSHR